MDSEAIERLREYVTVVRGIGLTETAVRAAHGGTDDTSASLVRWLATEFDRLEEQTLHERLVETIVQSPRGIDAPAQYWNHAPEVHLETVLDPYDCRVSIEPARGVTSLSDGQYVIRFTDASGQQFWTRFEYPDSPLGTDNYPAIVTAIEETFLSCADLTIVRLQETRARRWQFALLTDPQLEALQRRYGDRVSVFGEPLLHEDQPEAFDTDSPPVPEWYDPSDESSADPEDEGVDDRPTVSSPELPDTAELDEFDPDDVEVAFDADADDPLAIVDEADGHDPSTLPGASDLDAVIEADDDEIESALSDLSDVSLDPEPEPPSNAAEPDPTGVETTGIGTDGDEVLDTAFEELERDIVDAGAETGHAITVEADPDIAELTGLDPADTDTGASEGETETEAGIAARGPSEGSRGSMASELFSEL